MCCFLLSFKLAIYKLWSIASSCRHYSTILHQHERSHWFSLSKVDSVLFLVTLELFDLSYDLDLINSRPR
jgi:hypothetical protein